MNHKRLADRLGHKERRKEQKQQIGKTEDDIADIKASLQALTLQLQSLPSVPAAPTPAARQDMSLGYAGSGSSMTTLSRESTLAPLPGWPFTSSPQSHGLGISMTPSTPIAAPSADMWSFLSRSDSTKILNCRCGLQHPDRFDCLESYDVTNVYRQHTVFPQSPNPARALPRNPSLPAMMLHSMDENPATFLITGFLRQFGHRSLEQLLGFYLMGYRYMRVSCRAQTT